MRGEVGGVGSPVGLLLVLAPMFPVSEQAVLTTSCISPAIHYLLTTSLQTDLASNLENIFPTKIFLLPLCHLLLTEDGYYITPLSA